MKTITTALAGLRLLETAADRVHQLTGEVSSLVEMKIEDHEVQHATAVQHAVRAEYAVEEVERLSLTFDAQVHEGNARVIAEQTARRAAEYAERIRLQAANLDRIAAGILEEVAPVDLAVVVVGPLDPLVIQATQPPQQLQGDELAPVETDNCPDLDGDVSADSSDVLGLVSGDELRAWRKGLGWTQADMAERLGVSQASVCAWEGRGDQLIPSYRARQVRGVVDGAVFGQGSGDGAAA